MNEKVDDRGKDREAILAHIRSIFKAFAEKDEETLNATHLPEWKGFTLHAPHVIKSREEYLNSMKDFLQNQTLTSYEIEEIEMEFYGDCAVAAYVAMITGRDSHERPFQTRLCVLDVYRKQKEDWNLAASSVSFHPDALRSSPGYIRVL